MLPVCPYCESEIDQLSITTLPANYSGTKRTVKLNTVTCPNEGCRAVLGVMDNRRRLASVVAHSVKS
ncbi:MULTISPECIES: hypothetical protein [Hyphobacterium]|uniref:Zinc finger Ogr/Delta-type domain-containing protein n=1 Tax=Hyphobacterium vulgare TaxID=1736751 RepID=A0ABV6ZU76_9PROT